MLFADFFMPATSILSGDLSTKFRSLSLMCCRKIEFTKTQVRAKVEYPFRAIKRQFGSTKVRFRGLVKNTTQQAKLFALSNLWMVRKRLLAIGEVRL
ncbi:Mobile element protein [Pseudomonas cannabina pv. alisalensis]|nr:Mobile element protein [Pseudomonas cannabina pv. alisalensis]